MSETHLTIKRWFRPLLDEPNPKYMNLMRGLEKAMKKKIAETQGQYFILDVKYPRKIFHNRKSFMSIEVYLHKEPNGALLGEIEAILDGQKFISFFKKREVN